GRIGLHCYENEVEILRERVLERFRGLLDPELASVVVDQPDPRHSDRLVDQVLPDRPDGFDEPSRPQLTVTKPPNPPWRTTRPLRTAAPIPRLPTRLNPRGALGPGGEERCRSCFAELEGSKFPEAVDQTVETFLVLLAAPLAHGQRLVGLPVAVGDHERHLLYLGIAHALPQGFRTVVHLGAESFRPQHLGNTLRVGDVILPHREQPHLDGREPEGKGAAVVLDQDADEAL